MWGGDRVWPSALRSVNVIYSRPSLLYKKLNSLVLASTIRVINCRELWTTARTPYCNSGDDHIIIHWSVEECSDLVLFELWKNIMKKHNGWVSWFSKSRLRHLQVAVPDMKSDRRYTQYRRECVFHKNNICLLFCNMYVRETLVRLHSEDSTPPGLPLCVRDVCWAEVADTLIL